MKFTFLAKIVFVILLNCWTLVSQTISISKPLFDSTPWSYRMAMPYPGPFWVQRSTNLTAWFTGFEYAGPATNTTYWSGAGKFEFYRLTRVFDAFTIKSRAQDMTVHIGDILNLWVECEGQQPITYQWLHDYGPVPGTTNSAGATNLNLQLRIASPQDGGRYTVTIRNPLGVRTISMVLTVDLQNFAPASIAGRRFRISITVGTPPFGTSGEYLFQPDLVGNAYVVIGLSFLFPNSFGTYAYTRLNGTSARINFDDSIVGPGFSQVITFSSAITGIYVLTKPGSPGSQTGSFTIVN